jgi:hypothetical protein
VKLDIEDEDVGLAVADKLLLKPEQLGLGRWLRRGGNLDEVRGNCAVESGRDIVVHLPPMRIGGDVDEDMIRGLILAECVEEEGLPPVVVW